MKRQSILLFISLIFLLALSVSVVGQAQGPSDSDPTGVPEVVIPAEFMVDPDISYATSGSTEVYFTPQDENTSTTCLFLYNTGDTAAVVSLTTYTITGTQTLNTSISIPAAYLVRVCADPVSTTSGSWVSAVLVNMTTSSAYAKMVIPAGVKMDGYVVWNNDTIYDPFLPAPTLPLRFSTDPLTTFLPNVLNMP